jgi:hypothetical protein
MSLGATDFSSYRGLKFGMTLATAAKKAGIPLGDAKIIHQRPALIQEIEWYPWPPVLADPVKADPQMADPVREGMLCFINGEFFRIVTTYDRYKIEGMTS